MKITLLAVANVLAILMCVAPGTAHAQWNLRFGLTGTVSLYETARVGPEGELRLRGPVAGGEGAAAWGPLTFRVGYAEGWLDAEPGIAFVRTYVEGYILLGAVPLPGLEISVGPHARSLHAEGISRPSWFGQARVQYEAPIIPAVLGATFEGWGALLGETAERQPLSRLHGGAVGLALRPMGDRLVFRLRYGLDEAKYDGGLRHRTLDMLTFTFGYGLP